ncbi:hypothetical protein RclHR1_01020031 [Rhizophagus clarus]|uniref:Uncharacterized protein n=1 Tax=Rhizophagus clarus TaxID=94130 RepID=A0A2Z6Q0Z5_9GLOM|nr:hypothetical protein RclHR1_01020031 [Rhizophagus clarus]GES76525.1 hypothetical protein GLOIN_2v1587570 [Rhizophagus clarus]
MTLKKYNIIIYFTIILILVVNVIIAQEKVNTLAHSPTTSAKSPEGTTIPTSSGSTEDAAESCLNNISCTNANDTLKLCNGSFKTPDKYIEEGIRNGTYRPEDRSLARCMCNQPYYDTLSKCLGCFVNATGTEFVVSPIEDYKKQCDKAGTTFTQTMPEIKSTITPAIKWGLVGGILLVVIVFIGIIVYNRYKKKNSKDKHKISVEGSGNLSTSDEKYPPPQSPSVQYRNEYAPPADTPYYPPPSDGQDGQYPLPQQHGVQGGQGSQYPPPPQQHGGGQGGQSDSYYSGSF